MARTRRSRFYVAIMTVAIAGGAIYGLRTMLEEPQDPPSPVTPSAPQIQADATPTPPVPETPVAAVMDAAPATTPAAPATAPVAAGLDAARTRALADAAAALAAGNPVQARRALNSVVDVLSDSPANEQVVQQLLKLAEETLFSPRVTQDDPLTLKHIVANGENLQKIANTYKITVPLICRVNGLADANRIRLGQPLKVPVGPFHAVVCKRTFRLYLYCQDTLVKVFPVALGAEDTTPTGTWRIKNKLTNPPYYPPRGGSMIAADDPANPLGEYWMALEGVEGAAVGQEGYGIHGTNEPDTIGRNVSLGCIRLRNDDAERVYEMLVVRDSVVTIKD